MAMPLATVLVYWTELQLRKGMDWADRTYEERDVGIDAIAEQLRALEQTVNG